MPLAWFTDPDPRNSRALKKAWVNRWNIAKAYAPTPSASIMYPSWLTVEYASTRLMSFITRPIDAAKIAVNAPMTATTIIIWSDAWNTGKNRATRKTPAATIVAAWISALTGVGPSIASGSHVCSGNWPDLPTAPAKMPAAIQVATPPAIIPVSTPAYRSVMSRPFSPAYDNVSCWKNRYMIASRKPKSPTLVTMKAFFAALAADGLVNQKPISRYEHRPTSSQNTKTWMMFEARTSPTIEVVNRDMYAK